VPSEAFDRAVQYLDFARSARNRAIRNALFAAILFPALILLIPPFVDALNHRGRVSEFARMPPLQQSSFAARWAELPEDKRLDYSRHVAGDDLAATVAEADLPLPFQISPDTLKAWKPAKLPQGLLSIDPHLQMLSIHELRWQAWVWQYLYTHAGEPAATRWNAGFAANGTLALPSPGAGYTTDFGILSTLVRQHDNLLRHPLGWLGRTAPWLWDTGGTFPATLRTLTVLFFMGIVFSILRTWCLIRMRNAEAASSLEAVTRMRRALYTHSSRIGSLSLRSSGVHDIAEIFTLHIDTIRQSLMVHLTTFRHLVQFGLLLVIAIALNPLLGLCALLFAALIWFLGGQITASFRQNSRVAARHLRSRLMLLSESLRIMRLVKSYLMEPFNLSRVERQLSEYARVSRQRSSAEAFGNPILFLLSGMAFVTILYLAGRMILEHQLGEAELVLLTSCCVAMPFSIMAWLHDRRLFRRAADSSGSFFEFLDRKSEISQTVDAEFLPGLTQKLEFDGVSLREPGEAGNLLSDINFEFEAGQMVGLVGIDDNEKHAIVSLVTRFLDPSKGEVRIDGRNLRWVSTESLRLQTGLVLQNQLIFSDTILNNIGCGDSNYNLPQIIEAAKLAHVHQFVQKLPYGYETRIGDFGQSLTTGEQFRIALARAILRDPALYIIEEPAIPLDDTTRELIDDTMSRILPGRTVLFLPHRISTLKKCDVVFLLHNGTIAGTGRHHDLLKKDSLYRHLYYLEFNEYVDQT